MPLTISCKGSFVVPSNNIDVLPLVNEFTQDPRKLTTAQSPLGGVNGLVSYSPGSVHVTEGDGIYLTDVAGNNTSKDLPAGLLSRLGYLTVDPVAHTITEEFIVANTATSNNPTVIDSCDATTGWTIELGTGTISVDNGRLKIVGSADSAGKFRITKNKTINLTNVSFLCVSIESNVNAQAACAIWENSNYQYWYDSRFVLTANSPKRYTFPVKSPVGIIGYMPTAGTGTVSNTTRIVFGIQGLTNGQNATFYIDDITTDVAKSAYIETTIPDNITSVVYQKWTGSAYETNCIAIMDPAYSQTFLDSAKMVLGDGTKFDDVYGSGLGRSRFIKGVAGQTVNGSLAGTTMTYSAIKGTKNRIGTRIDLPPSDGGRTAFNQCRIKKIIYYTDVNRVSVTLPDVSGNGNNGTMSCVGLTADNAGNAYGAMSFDGVRSYVSIPNHVSLNPTSAITICARMNVVGTAFSGRNNVLSKNGASSYQVGGETGTKKLQMYVVIGGTLRYVQSVSDIQFGQWVDVVWQYPTQNSKIGIFINGVLDAESAVYSGNIGTDTTAVKIGYNGAQYYTGGLCDVREYARALTPDEITAYHNNQPLSSTGLVAQWQPSTVSHMGQSTYDLSNDNNASTGLLNIAKPWLAVINATSKIIDYYVFSSRPKSLYFKKDETGNIYQIVVNPGFGRLYKGQAVYSNMTLDTNSDGKPDFLDATLPSSLARLLSMYRFNG